ncbi:hypothetical protein SNK04_002342 [Fusarium graminearum]
MIFLLKMSVEDPGILEGLSEQQTIRPVASQCTDGFLLSLDLVSGSVGKKGLVQSGRNLMSVSVFMADGLRLALIVRAVVITAGLIANVSVGSSSLRSGTKDIILSILGVRVGRRRERRLGILSLIAQFAGSMT